MRCRIGRRVDPPRLAPTLVLRACDDLYAGAMVDVVRSTEVPGMVGHKSIRVLLIVLILGAMIGAVIMYLVMRSRSVPEIVRGTVSGVAADSDGAGVTSIAFRFDDRDYVTSGEGESVPIAAHVPWTDVAGETHEGNRPVCLAAGSNGQRVELALLDVRGEGAWPSRLVVWVHCLS